ncbi:MAG TPA: hypothetical protein DF383_03325, partial [Deltaproteobacteria bacterium]|nr:hypothetical protein [Deltaproteobacteria bacterium]
MLGTFGTACRRTPAVDKKASAFSKAESEAPQNLILKKGMRIKLRQLEFVDEGKLIPSEQEHGWVRTLSVENPSGAEGLSFQWHLAASVPAPETGSRFNASGKMTLANLVGARRMTLPLFWPGGELFLSNSSAIWLSDEAFAELQKQGKTAWSLGLVDNALLGPAQGLAFLESSLENVQRSLESKPDEKAAAGELSITDKSVD